MERLTMTDDEMNEIPVDCPVKLDDEGVVNAFCERVCDEFSQNCPFDKLGKRLKEYEDLEEQGLLLKLPFKIGDTLYYIDDYEIYHDKVYSIEVTEVNGEHTFCVGCMDWIYDDFGKTVFLTKEEVEEALRKKVE